MVQRLEKIGVIKFEQIANWTDEDIANVDEVLSFKGRIEREDWVEQAKSLLAEATVDEVPAGEADAAADEKVEAKEDAKPEKKKKAKAKKDD